MTTSVLGKLPSDEGASQRKQSIAFALMPLVAGATTLGLFPLYSRTDVGVVDPSETRDAAIAIAITASLLAAIIVVLFARPTFLWWRRRHRITFLSTVLWGGFFGNVPTLFVTILAGISRSGSSRLLAAAVIAPLGTFVGFACAAIFWLIATGGGRQNL